MVVVCQITESYSQKVLVKIPDGTPNAEEKAKDYVEARYYRGELEFNVIDADYVDSSGEVSIAYSDDDSKFCNPDFTLDGNGKEI